MSAPGYHRNGGSGREGGRADGRAGDGTPLRVLVAGGGIGGLAAALALTRAGHEVTVAERAPRYEPAGAGIVLAANALHVLSALGVDLGPHSLALPSLDVVAADGTLLRRVEPQRAGRGYGPTRALTRTALHTALLDALPPAARPVTGRAVSALHDTGASVTVRFERTAPTPGAPAPRPGERHGPEGPGSERRPPAGPHAPELYAPDPSGRDTSDTQGSDTQGSDTRGSDTRGSDTRGSDTQGSDTKRSGTKRPESSDEETYDLVVGADGIRSTARAHVAARPPALRHSGVTCWRGLTGNPGVTSAVESWGPGTKTGLVPLPDGRLYYFLVRPAPRRAPAPAWPDAFRRAFAHHRGVPARLLDALDAPPPLHHDLEELDAPVWGRGRVLLLGDAAHAMTPNLGQGAAMAVEDAYALALALRAGADGAADRYRALRHRRVRAVQLASRHAGYVTRWRNPLAGAVREAAVRYMPTALQDRQYRGLVEPALALVREPLT
ncbi:FAD-dependent monooxygenase [Streptomyces fradiae]|uniref:FAD-dependent monooxygenase n=1 Tax=Streptomyces fradiae TaxID=1906 RepID=UPI0035BE853C